MNFSLFHFSHPAWLWGLLAIPAVLAAYAVLFHRRMRPIRLLERFADRHLLPHLVKNRQAAGGSLWPPLLTWALAWACGMAAMAGPQWRYTEMELFKPTKDLVIVLDLSSSMNAADVKPSRLVRAREEINDLIDMNQGLTIGLVAYAIVPHMVVPLTDDMRTIRNLLPSIDTSLITIDGDQLKPALEMAARMLANEAGRDKSILVVSDGDFMENNIAGLAQAAGGAPIDTMGVGTSEGAPIPETDGGWVKDKDDKILIDRLQVKKLQALSAASHGVYVKAVYSDSDTRALLDHIGGISDDQRISGKTVRAWDEGFYVPAMVLALLLLPWFRKGSVFPVLILSVLMTPAHKVQAAEISDWFRNPAQQGRLAYDQAHYEDAVKKFSDPYQRGVAAYRAGQFDKAEGFFKVAVAENKSALDAEYNLGNAQLMQNKPEDAIDSYESVLKQEPTNASAKHNLDIARKMLQRKQQQQQSQQNQQNDQNSGRQNDNKQNQKQDNSGQNSNQKQVQQKSSQNSQKTGQTQSRQTQQQGQRRGPQLGQTQQNNQSTGRQKPANQNQIAGADQAGAEPVNNRVGQSNADATAVRPRTQRDIDADQWLNHIQSDSSSFLKNQFRIEEQQSITKQEDQQ